MRSLLVLILLSGLTACAASSQKPSGADPVVTDTGSVRSYVAEGGVLQWYDIPFAQPPVDELRWRAPAALSVTDQLLTRMDEPVICP